MPCASGYLPCGQSEHVWSGPCHFGGDAYEVTPHRFVFVCLVTSGACRTNRMDRCKITRPRHSSVYLVFAVGIHVRAAKGHVNPNEGLLPLVE